ncbi:prepilin peptidase [Marinilactibacillus piezotolerans]|uniref:prepilin peptidase n=1 Tax=Marinilactibacillus piezotolerans TaxID=258723 RepID=UPI0009AF5D2A|nr:A24 family peptidase [Marinilactibacillus piezotolerans]
MEWFIGVIFFIYGIVLGSFYNVVGLRVPNGTFLKEKQSYCYTCQRTLSWKELIPVYSFAAQKGKCRGCGESISFIYPMIELLTGILFVVSYMIFGLTIQTAFSLVVVSMIMIITVSDIAYQKIPNKLLLIFLPILFILKCFIPGTDWLSSLIGAGLAFLLLAVIIFGTKGGMGMGDLKYFMLFGFLFGWPLFFLLFFLSTIYGALINGLLLAGGKVTRKTKVPFGPYIGAAALTVLFFGPSILEWYWSFYR